jgi:hypothetical protein
MSSSDAANVLIAEILASAKGDRVAEAKVKVLRERSSTTSAWKERWLTGSSAGQAARRRHGPRSG